MLAPAVNDRLVHFDRATVYRMLSGAMRNAYFADSQERRRFRILIALLKRSLAEHRMDRIEFAGPEHQLRRMLADCGDVGAAFEAGRQLGVE